jgi:integrase/recombinase XerD
MHHEKINILFVLNQAKTNQKGVSPIYFRITINKVRKQFSTGLTINPKDWNSKKQLAESKLIDYTVLNGQLSIIKQKINNYYFKLQLENESVKIEDLIDAYFQKPTKKEDSVLSYFLKWLNKQEKLIGKDIKQITWDKFNYVYQDVKRFINHHYKMSDFPLEDLSVNFLNQFEYYLKTVKENKQVTINKALQRLKKPIKESISEGYLTVDPFMLHRSKKVTKEIVFLTFEELTELESHTFNQPRLSLIRDLFIFCCYTGLPYLEMVNLKKEHLIIGFDKQIWIRMKREKTSRIISIPLLPKAKNILEIRKGIDEFLLPSISNQKFNSYLKEIAEILGLEKKLTHHIARKTFASTVLLFNDVPMEIVSELLGHSSITITQESYAKVIQKKVSEEMKKLEKKLK